MRKLFGAIFAWFVGYATLVVTALTSFVFVLLAIFIVSIGVTGVLAFGAGLIVLFLGTYILRGTRAWSRSVAASAYGVQISVPRPRRARHRNLFVRWLLQLWYDWRDAALWRGLAYEAVMVLLSWLAVFVGTVLMGAGVGVMIYADPDVIAVSGIVSVEQNLAPLAQFGAVQQRLLGAGAAVLGIVLVWLLSSSQRALAQTLLSATTKNQLSQQVHELGAARQGAVDAAEAERQRIERDLHDGAQPQLVALAMTLGLAQTAIKTDTRAAAALIDEAHAQAKQAITDLRQLARGIHPAVLTDRGLDAALSSIVARSPIPCDLDVRMPTRAAPEIEAAAYFVVAEALTNVAKHSQASQASVQIYSNPGGLSVSVVDNGRGGARVIDHQLGTSGLKGLADRVAATGGELRLHSPEGGPTHLSVSLPLNPSAKTQGLMTTCA